MGVAPWIVEDGRFEEGSRKQPERPKKYHLLCDQAQAAPSQDRASRHLRIQD
jgi:hypothetical protein